LWFIAVDASQKQQSAGAAPRELGGEEELAVAALTDALPEPLAFLLRASDHP
jgi:hypothetical protein